MNGIVEVIISLSEYSKIGVSRLCHETDCKDIERKVIRCINCPLCFTRFTKSNAKLFYGDEND